jgi:hypothetical protein
MKVTKAKGLEHDLIGSLGSRPEAAVRQQKKGSRRPGETGGLLQTPQDQPSQTRPIAKPFAM